MSGNNYNGTEADKTISNDDAKGAKQFLQDFNKNAKNTLPPETHKLINPLKNVNYTEPKNKQPPKPKT